ncbi:MAG: DUF4426 domain-containing protein [Betaproteobacteria bacterium]|nr:DUF4426 domain-containing protein [Betaproteobacteria bacterium]
MRVLLILAAAFSLLPATAAAERLKRFGDLEVHYNALVTAELAPEVARAYKIDRSGTRGLVTVSVLRKNNLGVLQPVRAGVKVNAVNLSAQLAAVPMREIQEGTAVYYIGEYRMKAPDTLKFSVTVTPEGAKNAHQFEFRQQFF